MGLSTHSSSWWGAPKKFDPNFKERKISWLELFYDLVYVIAISRITYHLGSHISISGFFEYAFLFILIFWGWLNGSLYHDIHGNEGLRTRLMTLWQMMIIAALTISIDRASFNNMIIVFMIMQFYITYLWWSVGIYDKEHRRYNKPYTILYLLSLALMGACLIVPGNWIKLILSFVLLLNYAPPFVVTQILRRSSLELSLSSSMTERLGLFTIIVFGEVVLGVVNGISKAPVLNASTWLGFALALAIVFILWWMFFTLISNRDAKKGFVRASLLEILYIPALMSLGLVAASLSHMFEVDTDPDHSGIALNTVFGYALAVFLVCISVIPMLLEYPVIVNTIKKKIRVSLLITAAVFVAITWVVAELKPVYYLLIVLCILIAEIYYLNSLYYGSDIEKSRNDVQM